MLWVYELGRKTWSPVSGEGLTVERKWQGGERRKLIPNADFRSFVDASHRFLLLRVMRVHWSDA